MAEEDLKECCTLCGMVSLGCSLGVLFVVIRESLGLKL